MFWFYILKEKLSANNHKIILRIVHIKQKINIKMNWVQSPSKKIGNVRSRIELGSSKVASECFTTRPSGRIKYALELSIIVHSMNNTINIFLGFYMQ